MSAAITLTAHCYPHAESELEQIQRAIATLAKAYPKPPPTIIAVWSLAWHPRGVWSIERTDEIVLVIHSDAWRLVERDLIPGRAADPAGVLTLSLLGMPVVDIDAGGREALRLHRVIHDTICRALAGVKL